MWVPYGIESPEGYDAVYPKVIARYLGVLDKEDSNAPSLSRYGFINNYKSPLINLLNVKYILLKKDDKQNIINLKNIGYEEAFSDKSILIYENNNYYPRAFVVYDWEISDNNINTFNHLLDSDFPFFSKVVLEKNPEIIKTKNSKYQLSFERYDLNSFLIRLESQNDGILFLSNVYYPGWEAYVDGYRVDILRADFAFQSIIIPKGNHDIEFIYNPKSFRIGKLITIITLIVLVVYYLYDKRKK